MTAGLASGRVSTIGTTWRDARTAEPRQHDARQRRRRDAWWLAPLATGVGLDRVRRLLARRRAPGRRTTSTPAAARSYLSPFYSPDLESMFGIDLPFSPAFLVLWAPLGLAAHLLLLPQGVLPLVLPAPRRPARSPGRASGATAARPASRSSSRTRTATSSTCGDSCSGSSGTTPVRAFFFRTDDGSLELRRRPRLARPAR